MQTTAARHHLAPSRMAAAGNPRKWQVSEDVEKGEPSCAAGAANGCSCCGQCGHRQKYKQHFHMTQQLHFGANTQRNGRKGLEEMSLQPCSESVIHRGQQGNRLQHARTDGRTMKRPSTLGYCSALSGKDIPTPTPATAQMNLEDIMLNRNSQTEGPRPYV